MDNKLHLCQIPAQHICESSRGIWGQTSLRRQTDRQRQVRKNQINKLLWLVTMGYAFAAFVFSVFHRMVLVLNETLSETNRLDLTTLVVIPTSFFEDDTPGLL